MKEIYGCSEAGSLASRRSTDGSEWLTLEGVVFEHRGDAAVVSAPHLSETVLLQDSLEIIAADRFRFLGRGSDMLNIAGKRASLDQLSAQLLAVEGVSDAIVFVRPDEARIGDSGRPAALVVSERPLRAIRRDLLLQQEAGDTLI